MQDIYDILAKSEAGVKVVLLDGWQLAWQKDAGKLPVGLQRKRVDEKVPQGISVLYSCGVGGHSVDHRGFRHGVFYFFVNRGLQGEADMTGSGNKDGAVSLQELGAYLEEKVSAYVTSTYKKPQLSQKPQIELASNGPHLLLKLTKGLTLYTQGVQLLEDGKHDLAVQSLAKAQTEAKDFVEIYLQTARALGLKKKKAKEDKMPDDVKWEQVLENCKTALQLDPTCATAHDYLAQALLDLELEKDKSQRNFDKVLIHHAEAIKLEKHYGPAYYTRAVTYTWQGKVTDAISDLTEKAIPLYPSFKEAHYWLGLLYDVTGDYPEAVKALEKAVDLDPDWQKARDALEKVKKKMQKN
jgi:tetratricopeptide (TPR) repeat protein